MNELDSKFHLGRTKWYALLSHYEGMREQLFSVIDGQEYEPLYLLTSLDVILEISPVFIELKSDRDPLLTELPEASVFYYSAPSEVPFSVLVAHLRLRLNVLFDGLRKGLLHYYHPRVASYFFSRSSDKETSAWLGPFSSVQFLEQCFDREAHWVECGDGGSVSDNSTWIMQPSQDRALTQQCGDQEIRMWLDAHHHESVDWAIQQSATQFCDQLTIIQPELRVRLRNAVHHYQVNPRRLNTGDPQFSELATEQKIECIEQYLAREY
jgi:hypothetical protein